MLHPAGGCAHHTTGSVHCSRTCRWYASQRQPHHIMQAITTPGAHVSTHSHAAPAGLWVRQHAHPEHSCCALNKPQTPLCELHCGCSSSIWLFRCTEGVQDTSARCEFHQPSRAVPTRAGHGRQQCLLMPTCAVLDLPAPLPRTHHWLVVESRRVSASS